VSTVSRNRVTHESCFWVWRLGPVRVFKVRSWFQREPGEHGEPKWVTWWSLLLGSCGIAIRGPSWFMRLTDRHQWQEDDRG